MNNAGTFWRAPFEKHPLDQWERTLAVDLTAPFVLGQRVIPHMTRGQG